VPSFLVFRVEAGTAVHFAAEQEASGANGVKRDDVPRVFRDDVGGDEIDFSRAVGDGAASGATVSVDAIEAVEKLGGSFDLDAPQEWERAGKSRFLDCDNRLLRKRSSSLGMTIRLAGVEDEVVAFAVAVGLADGEAHAGGDELEDEFGEFSATLGGAFTAERIDGRDMAQARRGRASG